MTCVKSESDKRFQKWWHLDPQCSAWIKEVPSDSSKAHCKVCQTDIRAHKSDLKKHAGTVKHLGRSEEKYSYKSLRKKK